MSWLFSWCFLAIINFSVEFNTTKIKFDEYYGNQSTEGDLIPRLYEVLPSSDTREHAVRILITYESFTLYPISVTVMRGNAILPTLLPRYQKYEEESQVMFFLGETLCESRNLKEGTFTTPYETVRMSVSSGLPVQYGFNIFQNFDFVLRPKRPTTREIYAPTPDFFRFSFPSELKTVAIKVRSDNDVCGRVTIQKAHCPVFDTEGQVILNQKYEHQTITRKGYIIISREDFGVDIHVIISVLPVDYPCQSLTGPSRDPDNRTNPYRMKKFQLEVVPFYPNKTSIYLLLELFIILLAIAVGLAVWMYDENNEDTEDSILNGTTHFWTYSLSQVYAVIPLAVILVSLRNSSDMDYCNFNYECAIPWGPFKAANNMLSASSIIVVGLINFWVSWCVKRVRRLFPLNVWILTTGILWTLMNICPQKHSFYLYTMTMLMTIVEAKFLVFGKRNGRNLKHYKVVGCFTMILMVLNVFEEAVTAKLWKSMIWFAALLWTQAAYVLYFSYAHGMSKDENENSELIKSMNLQSDRLEPLNDETNYASGEQGAPRLLDINTEHNEEPVDDEQPSTSDNIDEEDLVVIPERQNSNESLIPNMELLIPQRNMTKTFKKMYLILGLLNILFWALSYYYWFDSSVVILRVVQTDFAIYFVLYFLNKVSYEKVFRKSFYGLFALFVLLLVAWGVISTYYLPAFVQWAPAESRTLNRSCFAINNYCLGMDWHDVLHFITAAICFLYPLIVSKIDQAFKVNEPARTF